MTNCISENLIVFRTTAEQPSSEKASARDQKVDEAPLKKQTKLQSWPQPWHLEGALSKRAQLGGLAWDVS